MNILVVDDDLVSLQSVVEKVRANVELSDHVYGFTSPERMLEHAQGHLCDVVFLKIELPNISGLEVARRLKQIQPKVMSSLKAIPTVICAMRLTYGAADI